MLRSTERCRVTLVFNVKDGEVDGTDVSGLTVAAVARHSIRIGDAVDFEIEDVVPFGSETGRPARLTGIFHPAGSELTVAHATRSKIDAFGIQYEGNSAFSLSPFLWAA